MSMYTRACAGRAVRMAAATARRRAMSTAAAAAARTTVDEGYVPQEWQQRILGTEGLSIRTGPMEVSFT